jgi:hypothetical protein
VEGAACAVGRAFADVINTDTTSAWALLVIGLGNPTDVTNEGFGTFTYTKGAADVYTNPDGVQGVSMRVGTTVAIPVLGEKDHRQTATIVRDVTYHLIPSPGGAEDKGAWQIDDWTVNSYDDTRSV